MKTRFTPDQKEVIREWAHKLDNAFRNLLYLQECLSKEVKMRDRLKTIQTDSIKGIESVIVSMNSVSPRPEKLKEAQNG